MKIVDANVLLNAINSDAPHHHESRRWLDEALSGGETVGFTWVVLLAFIRISTKPGIFPQPLETTDAMDVVEAWLAAPTATLLTPFSDHHVTLRRLLEGVGTAGNLTTDAHLGAYALHYDATIVSYDSDFARFDSVRWITPG